MQIKKLVAMPSRKGRDLQRYNKGCRQVVGCIPYRFRQIDKPRSIRGTSVEDLEFLLISSQKSTKWMFPKGGWELDETIEEAAHRETMEEAGVLGVVENKLGTWSFKSKSQDTMHEGHMFAFKVNEELHYWPEKDVRRRIWLTASEAMEICEHDWMKYALDVFDRQLKEFRSKEEQHWTLDFLRLEEEKFCSVDEIGEEDGINSHLVQLTHLQKIDGECRIPCSLEYLLEDSRIGLVAQGGEEELSVAVS